MVQDGRILLFSGDYYDAARVHMSDPIVGQTADLAVLDCDYGTRAGASSREEQVSAITAAIDEALRDGRPVLLPVPRYGRGQGVLTVVHERLPQADLFGDTHFLEELGHLSAASSLWVQPRALDMLADTFVRPIPEEFVALGVYFISDPQLDRKSSLELLHDLLICGARVIMTGTVESGTQAASLMHSGHARMLRYAIHCTQEEMIDVACQNNFRRIIAYHSDYAPTQGEYEV